MPRATLFTVSLCMMTGIASMAPAVDEIDPSDLVPRLFTVNDFSKLSALELYDVSLALKRGRNILIEGCSASQSRAIFEASHANRAPALDMLRATCGD